MEFPLITVITCVYNGENYIKRCIESVLAQTYRPIEYIIVDDGSKDNTLSICRTYDAECLRIIKKEQNSGLSEARNTGLCNVHGKYVTFVDADDYAEPNFLSELYNAIETEGADLSVCAYYKEMSYGKKCVISYGESRTIDYENAMCAIFEDNSWGGYTWNKLMKMSIINDILLRYSPEFKKGEDMVALCRYMKKCKVISYINSPLYHYMYNESSICRSEKRNKEIDDRDLSNLKAHIVMKNIINDDSEKIKKAFGCRLVCTNMRLLVNMSYCQEKDKKQARKSQKAIRKNLFSFIRSPYHGILEKGGALLMSVNPSIFWMSYAMLNKIFGITIT